MATIYGTNGNDTQYGTQSDDILKAWAEGGDASSASGHDHLFGGNGDDHLHSGDGNDYLFGGTGRDHLHGDAGRDTFVLGANSQVHHEASGNHDYAVTIVENGQVYYDTAGNSDYAVIYDLNTQQDYIQLQGSSDDYNLRTFTGNTGIYHGDELIGIVNGVSGLNLDASYFSYV